MTGIGWRAHAALTASGGQARVTARLSESCYAEAAGELIWLGPPDSALHPRAVLGPIPASDTGVVDVGRGDVTPWRPAATFLARASSREAFRLLRDTLATLGEPRGFARLGTADRGDDPILARARRGADRLKRTARANDTSGFVDAARLLLGLGEGLTPSGDDFVGGVLFGRRCVFGAPSSAWDGAIQRILDEARAHTHPVSALLLTDLAAGEGWEPLHDLTAALALRQPEAARVAAQQLTAIGHSSGWDLLSGFALGLDG